MKTHMEQKSQSATNSPPQNSAHRTATSQFIDNRSEAVSRKRLLKIMNGSQIQRMIIQRAKNDIHNGIVKIKKSDKSLAIYVESQMRPWFNLPDASDLVDGDTVTFKEGDDREVTELIKSGHNQTDSERLEELNIHRIESGIEFEHANGDILYSLDIENGFWRNLNRRDSPHDYEFVAQLGDGLEYYYHVHPPKFAGRAPIPGQVMRNGVMTQTQTNSGLIETFIKVKGLPSPAYE